MKTMYRKRKYKKYTGFPLTQENLGKYDNFFKKMLESRGILIESAKSRGKL